MIMGGAILKMNFRSQILMKVGICLNMYCHIWFCISFCIHYNAKKNNHKNLEIFSLMKPKTLPKEFIKWFKLTAEINPVLKWFRQKELNIPTFYVMGEEDYMFYPPLRKLSQSIPNLRLFWS